MTCNGTFAQRSLLFLWGALDVLHTMHTVMTAFKRSHLPALWCEEGESQCCVVIAVFNHSHPSVTTLCVVLLYCAPCVEALHALPLPCTHSLPAILATGHPSALTLCIPIYHLTFPLVPDVHRVHLAATHQARP